MGHDLRAKYALAFIEPNHAFDGAPKLLSSDEHATQVEAIFTWYGLAYQLDERRAIEHSTGRGQEAPHGIAGSFDQGGRLKRTPFVTTHAVENRHQDAGCDPQQF